MSLYTKCRNLDNIVWHTIKPGMPEHGTMEHGTLAEQWNTPEQWQNSGTPQNSGRTMEHPEHQQNTWKYQQNFNITPVYHPRTTEPYKMKNNCSDFKENLNLTSMHLTLSTQGGSIFYC